ncbi:adenosylcobinamide-GDP ribazoletransferase [Janibacter corallicola]|uniref:adenosylcobinamide-GDP ribazoletransferase n=1 Tax=Janibacter corallicola TaxID=415212 RepID=UPI000837854A|nr:adenosylcobinamide-GDP ribazoletransferase [Janibacter corallicola]
MTTSGLRLAVGTFTRIPSGRVDTSPASARSALLLAPVAVLPLAVLAGLVAALVELRLPPLVAAGLALVVLAHGSRGMHLDGLADVVDGLGASAAGRARALEVMRRGDVGPMGAIALVLVLLLQAAALADLLRHGWPGGLLFAVAVLLSRAVPAVVCAHGTPAAEGSRLGAAFVGTVPPFAATCLFMTLTIALAAAGLVHGLAAPVVTVLAALAALVAALWLRRQVIRGLGGVGGDAIGAAVEVALTVTLVCLTVAW